MSNRFYGNEVTADGGKWEKFPRVNYAPSVRRLDKQLKSNLDWIKHFSVSPFWYSLFKGSTGSPRVFFSSSRAPDHSK